MQHGENNDSPPPTDLSEFLKILYLRSGSVRVSGDPDSPARRWATNKCVRNYIVSIYLAIEFMNSEYLTLRSLRIGPTMSQDWSDSEYPGKKWLSRWINQSFTRWQNKLSVRLAWLNDWLLWFRIGGTMGAILTCPLEVIKTRLQATEVVSSRRNAQMQTLRHTSIYYTSEVNWNLYYHQHGSVNSRMVVFPESVLPWNHPIRTWSHIR